MIYAQKNPAVTSGILFHAVEKSDDYFFFAVPSSVICLSFFSPFISM